MKSTLKIREMNWNTISWLLFFLEIIKYIIICEWKIWDDERNEIKKKMWVSFSSLIHTEIKKKYILFCFVPLIKYIGFLTIIQLINILWNSMNNTF